MALAGGCGAPATSTACDPQAFQRVAQARAGGAEVTVCGTVVRVGRLRRTRSGRHRSFDVDAGSERIEIDANVDILGDVPVRRGERAVVRGEYYYDAGGRDGIHWTHRTVHGSHPAGYLILDGTTYQ